MSLVVVVLSRFTRLRLRMVTRLLIGEDVWQPRCKSIHHLLKPADFAIKFLEVNVDLFERVVHIWLGSGRRLLVVLPFDALPFVMFRNGALSPIKS